MPTIPRPSVNAEHITHRPADFGDSEWFLGDAPIPSAALWLVDGMTLPVMLQPTDEFPSRLRVQFRGVDTERARWHGVAVDLDNNAAILTRGNVRRLGLWFARV